MSQLEAVAAVGTGPAATGAARAAAAAKAARVGAATVATVARDEGRAGLREVRGMMRYG